MSRTEVRRTLAVTKRKGPQEKRCQVIPDSDDAGQCDKFGPPIRTFSGWGRRKPITNCIFEVRIRRGKGYLDGDVIRGIFLN